MDYKNIINEQLEAMDIEALEELAGKGNAFGCPISASRILSPISLTESLFLIWTG